MAPRKTKSPATPKAKRRTMAASAPVAFVSGDVSAKRPIGRPSDYDPAYCAMVEEWGKLGKSKAWMAAEIGISKQTLYDWEKAHPEFLDATTRAVTFSQQWWEDAGQSGMAADKFNSAVWVKNMAARFREEWTERQEVTGANGSALMMPVINVTTTGGA